MCTIPNCQDNHVNRHFTQGVDMRRAKKIGATMNLLLIGAVWVYLITSAVNWLQATA
jgi:hypothetical protein